MLLNMPTTGEDETRASDNTPVAGLSVFQVMPREMYFGASRATSIDLCTRDLVAASRFRGTTTVFAEGVGDPFSGFTIGTLPAVKRGATSARAAHVAAAARSAPPDIIIVQQHLPTAAAIAQKLPHIKVVLQTHNLQKSYATSGGLWGSVRRIGRKRRYARLSGIIHVSNACAEHFAEAWPDIALPSCVVNNGLDFSQWRPSQDRSAEILCVARCAPEKGVLEAAQAVAALLPRFADWRARFILSNVRTHPDYFADVRHVLASLGAQVEIEEQRPFAEVKAGYEHAAIALVPSKWTEPFGRTALEAHAGGAALVSSGTGGLAEISGDAALMLPDLTPGAIEEVVEALIQNTGLRKQMAREGAARVRERFDIKVQARQLDAFCHSLVCANAATAQHPESPLWRRI